MINALSSKNTQPIPTMYAVMSIDKDGNEGIISIILPPVGAMPLVFGDKSLYDHFKPHILQIAKDSENKLRLVKFTQKEIIEEITN